MVQQSTSLLYLIQQKDIVTFFFFFLNECLKFGVNACQACRKGKLRFIQAFSAYLDPVPFPLSIVNT